jgi:hypothetical protein
MMSAADRYDAPLLRDACIAYILGPHKQEVVDHPSFKAELEANPPMLFPIIRAAPSVEPSGAPAIKYLRGGDSGERTIVAP